jgi:hypothetical protein
MSDQVDIGFIPGDKVTADLGEFTHHQHLVGVSVVYASASLAGERIVLTGEPRPSAGDASSGDSYTSRARVSVVIPEDAAPGRYDLADVVVHTRGGADRSFANITKGSLRGGGYSRGFSSSWSRTIHRCSFRGALPRPELATLGAWSGLG